MLSVKFGGVNASSFEVVSPNLIKAIVAEGQTGDIEVTTAYGKGTIQGFTFIPQPVITSFTPQTGTTGTIVIIRGKYFTAANLVQFGSINAASFTVDSATRITAVVAGGASGLVSVTAAGWTGSLAGFTYSTAPQVSSFSPSAAGAGDTVIIQGNNFTGTTSVSFGGTNAQSFVVNSPTKITAVVGNGSSGSVAVTTPIGTASMAGFNFNIPTALPVIDGLESFEAVPNPTNGLLNVACKLNRLRKLSFVMYDNTGQIVYKFPLITATGAYTKQIDMRHLTNGIYYLRVTVNNEQLIQKIILNK